MTPTFRLAVALAALAISVAFGLARAPGVQNPLTREPAPAVEIEGMPNISNVAGYVARIAESGMFPDANIDTEATRADPDGTTMASLEAAFTEPPIAGFVRSDGDWRVVIPVSAVEFQVLRTGDMLDGDWRVVSIDATRLVLEGPSGQKAFSAFPGDEGDT